MNHNELSPLSIKPENRKFEMTIPGIGAPIVLDSNQLVVFCNANNLRLETMLLMAEKTINISDYRGYTCRFYIED